VRPGSAQPISAYRKPQGTSAVARSSILPNFYQAAKCMVATRGVRPYRTIFTRPGPTPENKEAPACRGDGGWGWVTFWGVWGDRPPQASHTAVL
jgi:hypothetical protein